ncbi:ATP-binding protein [Rufibacter sediminis]|uniref:ATP-binding protein n=1 Tax=Rufibacter sediminis TaxID=2762756 RepID=A0ABR6VU20_9BACT|nr:ATP-binding protein [Rufibacter sediminis]MBC3540640.1 ATP-binding protein [Rufibacter sediminis]
MTEVQTTEQTTEAPAAPKTLGLEVRTHKPPRIVIYGPQGLGKSTFGAMMKKPVFIQTEDGLDNIDAPAFPLAKNFDTVMSQLRELATIDHDYKTVVIDSLDWLEPMIWRKVAQENHVENLEQIGYGKGYVMALDIWREYIKAVNYLRDKKGMMIVQTAHTEIKRFEDPLNESYDRYQIKLHRLAAGLILEHSDIVLFTNYYVGTTKKKEGFGDRTMAIGSGERVLYTEERPSFIAKNRYGLPAEIPFDQEGKYRKVIADHVPFFNKQKKDV